MEIETTVAFHYAQTQKRSNNTQHKQTHTQYNNHTTTTNIPVKAPSSNS